MEALLSILTSTGAGGIIGVVGSWLTKREERKNTQLQFERDVKMAEIRKDEAKIEADHELALADKQIERAQVEGSVAVDQAEVEAFTQGLKEQSKTYGIKAVDGIRGLMRPLITVYLLVIATLLTLKINQLVGGLDSLEMSELKGIYDNVINQMLFLTATAVTWWFGSRPSSQRRD
ncbi:MAG: hypothetical protein QMB64_00375 [Pseudomonadales bacterium]|jgi:hypothetical protein